LKTKARGGHFPLRDDFFENIVNEKETKEVCSIHGDDQINVPRVKTLVNATPAHRWSAIHLTVHIKNG
jgi:hypothetical protein